MSVQQSSTVVPGEIVGKPSMLKIVVQLFKLRIVLLLLFASLGGAFIANGGAPTLGELLTLLVAGGLGAAGASALNQYLERKTDGNMKRTRNRPLVNGTIQNAEIVLVVALAMILVPVAILAFSNLPMAFFILLGAIIYVLVYTVWLKPRTSLNIVIGGAAGSCAVLTGSAAVGAWDEIGALVLATILFFWTPTHFWALAIMVRDDYAANDVPMLPVRTDNRTAAIWGFAHAVVLAVCVVSLSWHPALGLVYIIPALLTTAHFLRHSWRLIQMPEKGQAKTLFLASNGYLGIILLCICISTVVGF